MNRAIFLDRDGTIIRDNGYIHKIEDLEFLPGSINGLKKLQESEYKLIIITNQSGIGRRFYTETDYYNFRNHLYKKLKENGIIITAEYFCPHQLAENCNCRKPKTGMLEKAAKDFNLNLKECWIIGDKPSDVEAGKNAGCKTIYVLTGKEKSCSVSYSDFVVDNLIKAAKCILDYKNK